MNNNKITVEVFVNAPLSKVWECWNEPKHMVNWCFASEDWHCPRASNDLKVGGKFTSRMEAKDGSFGFDFEGVYERLENEQLIDYSMEDGRKVNILFEDAGEATIVTETFDPENENPLEMQRMGWQAILNNFKSYTESL